MCWMMKMNLIVLISNLTLIQKTNHLFKSHQKDKDHIFVQSRRNSFERELLWKVVSDQDITYHSE